MTGAPGSGEGGGCNARRRQGAFSYSWELGRREGEGGGRRQLARKRRNISMQKRAEKGRKQQRKTKEKLDQVAGNGQRQNRKKAKK